MITGGKAQTSLEYFLFFAISQHQNFNILVFTPHNYQGDMWGRDKNFQVLMLYAQRNHENKKYARDICTCPPIISVQF